MNLSISVTNHLSSSCMCTKGCFAFADVGDCVIAVALPIKSLSCFNEDKKAHRVLLPYTQPLTSAKA